MVKAAFGRRKNANRPSSRRFRLLCWIRSSSYLTGMNPPLCEDCLLWGSILTALQGSRATGTSEVQSEQPMPRSKSGALPAGKTLARGTESASLQPKGGCRSTQDGAGRVENRTREARSIGDERAKPKSHALGQCGQCVGMAPWFRPRPYQQIPVPSGSQGT